MRGVGAAYPGCVDHTDERDVRMSSWMAGMGFVAINVLSVPGGRGDVLEQRFAARAGSVEKAPGFEHFELLRPLDGTDDYLVYTRREPVGVVAAITPWKSSPWRPCAASTWRSSARARPSPDRSSRRRRRPAPPGVAVGNAGQGLQDAQEQAHRFDDRAPQARD